MINSCNKNVAEVLLNNPNSWTLENCDLEFHGDDLVYGQTADVKIHFFDPQITSLFMSACHNTIQKGMHNYAYLSVIEDKDLDLRQHYVKDFGDD